MLYEMLVGETPLDAYYVFQNGIPVKTMVDKGCSEFAINIVKHAMQPKCADRYHTAPEMIDDLRTAIMNQKSIYFYLLIDNPTWC